MASVFLELNETGVVVANDNEKVFGQQGHEGIIILSGVTGVTLDQNVEQITLSGDMADYTFEQQGNQLHILDGGSRVVSFPVQADDDGTRLVFDNDTAYNAVFVDGDIVFQEVSVVYVDIDTGTPESPVAFNASGGAFEYSDDASVTTHVEISGFGSEDTIAFTNGDVDNYAFVNDGTDVVISYNYLDEGTMNVITLTGVVSSDAMVYDLASFTDAVGFDPFVV